MSRELEQSGRELLDPNDSFLLALPPIVQNWTQARTQIRYCSKPADIKVKQVSSK